MGRCYTRMPGTRCYAAPPISAFLDTLLGLPCHSISMGFALRRPRRTPVRFHCTGWVFTVPSLWNLSGALGCCGKRPNPVCPQGRCHNAPLQAPDSRCRRPKMPDGSNFYRILRADRPVHAGRGLVNRMQRRGAGFRTGMGRMPALLPHGLAARLICTMSSRPLPPA